MYVYIIVENDPRRGYERQIGCAYDFIENAQKELDRLIKVTVDKSIQYSIKKIS